MIGNFNHGWVCPKCGAVMGPSTPTCCYCGPNEYYVSGGTVPKQNSWYEPVDLNNKPHTDKVKNKIK